MKIIKGIVVCESSGTVRDAFRSLGHDFVSCDLLPTERPGPHYQVDARELDLSKYDLVIAHPPCTYLSSSGMHWTTRGLRDPKLTEDALDFVRFFLDGKYRLALENPVGVISTRIRKPDQIIQPWQFGHSESKATCLWLRGIPELRPTEIMSPKMYRCRCGNVFGSEFGRHGCPYGCKTLCSPLWDNQTKSGQNKLGPSEDRWKARSKTYDGIAAAMAKQWSDFLQRVL